MATTQTDARRLPEVPVTEPGNVLRQLRDQVMAETDDISTKSMPLVKVVSAFVLLIPVVWWASSLNARVDAVTETLTRIEGNVAAAVVLQKTVARNEQELEELRDELKKQREYWEVDTRNLLARLDRIENRVGKE